MEKRDKIIEKIKALLSKTIDNGASKQEMESALSKANQLMTAFFISEYDLKDNAIIEKCVLKQVERIKSGFDLSSFYGYVALLFDCKVFWSTEAITFFGHKQDVELCIYFYILITKTCLKEKDLYLMSSDYKKHNHYFHGKTLSSSFIKGFLAEISNKMGAMYKERKSNIPESYGLMVIEKIDKVKNEFESLNMNLKYRKEIPIKAVESAFNIGLESGSKINLVQGIESSEESNRYALGY